MSSPAKNIIYPYTAKVKRNTNIKPQSIEAERALLCSLFLDNSKIGEVLEIVSEDDFYDEKNAAIFKVLKELYTDGISFDFIIVSDALKERGLLEKVGLEYLTSITEFLPAPANAKYYAEIIRKKSILRQLISMSSEVATICYDEPEDVEEVLNIAEKRLINITLQNYKRNIVDGNVINNVRIETDEVFVHGVKVQNRRIWGLIGATSAGKTEFALDVAKAYSDTTYQPILYCQYEGTKEDLILRAQKKGRWVSDAVFLLKPNFSLILSHIKRNQQLGRKTFIIIDYLQRFARFLQTQREKEEKRVYESLRLYVNEIYNYFDHLREKYDISVLFILSMSKSEITSLSTKKKIDPQEMLNATKESGDVQYDLDYTYTITFSEKPDFSESHLGRFTVDGQARRYMQLRVAKAARTGAKLENHIYEYRTEENWSGYALVSEEEKEEDNLEDIEL